MGYTIENILEALNKHQVRATYSAVAALLGVHQRRVSHLLGNRRPYASWVVAKSTGMPTGYLKANLHKELQSKPTIIEEPDELIALLTPAR
jgi:hypothetical protein